MHKLGGFSSILVLLIGAAIIGVSAYAYFQHPLKSKVSQTATTTPTTQATTASAASTDALQKKVNELCAYYDDAVHVYLNSKGEVGGYVEFPPDMPGASDMGGQFYDAQGKGVDFGISYITESKTEHQRLLNKEAAWLTTVKKNYPIQKTIPCAPSPLTADDALQKVSQLPEVTAYIARIKAKKGDPHISVSDATTTDSTTGEDYWPVHVYENLGDHVVTFAWYAVYLNTGKVVEQKL